MVSDLHAHSRNKMSFHICRLLLILLRNLVSRLYNYTLCLDTTSCFCCCLSYSCNAIVYTSKDNFVHLLDRGHQASISRKTSEESQYCISIADTLQIYSQCHPWPCSLTSFSSSFYWINARKRVDQMPYQDHYYQIQCSKSYTFFNFWMQESRLHRGILI